MRHSMHAMLLNLLDRVRVSRDQHKAIQRLLKNVLSILTSDVFGRATTFLVYALVARYLGPHEFGQMSLALTVFYTFQVVAGAGLRTVIAREVSRNRQLTGSYLVNGSLVVALFSALSIVILWCFGTIMNYQPDTKAIILLLGLGLLPYGLSTVCEGIFQAWEQMSFIAIANVPINLLKICLAVALLQQGQGVFALVFLFVASYMGVVAIEWWLVAKFIVRPRLFIDLPFCRSIALTGSTFMWIDVLIAISASIPIILLSKLRNETEVGLFSAATQVTVPIILIFQSIVLSVFPVMCRRFDTGTEGLKTIAGYLLEALLFLAIPSAIALFYLAEPVLLLLYGNQDLTAAATALRISVWFLVFRAMTSALGQILWASQRERTSLRITAINLLLSIGAGVLLIYQFGVNGAAVASLLVAIVNYFLHRHAVGRVAPGIHLERRLWKPVIASIVMVICLALLRDQPPALAIFTAFIGYSATYVAMVVWTNDGIWRVATGESVRLPTQRD